MTGAQTDVVTVGSFDVCASALIRLAAPLFKEFSVMPESGDRKVLSVAWMVIRETAALLTQRRALELRKWEKDDLYGALRECAPSPDLDLVYSFDFTERG